MIELDHVSQSYTLNNNELDVVVASKRKLKKLSAVKRLGTSNERTYRSLLWNSSVL